MAGRAEAGALSSSLPGWLRSGSLLMERRVLLAIFLSFLVLYVYQALVVKPVPKPVLTPSEQTPSGNATSPGDSLPPPPPPTTSVEATTPPKPVAQALVSDAAERDIRIETQ